MATTFRPAPEDVMELAAGLMRRWHKDLVKADVSVRILFAFNHDAPPLTHGGWPAKALARITNLRDRVAGLADALILIDGHGWQEWSDAMRLAILDHELHHFEVRLDLVGNVRYDDANRPKLKMRMHDFQFGGFDVIVSRHREASAEAQAVKAVTNRWVQLEFNWDAVAGALS